MQIYLLCNLPANFIKIDIGWRLLFFFFTNIYCITPKNRELVNTLKEKVTEKSLHDIKYFKKQQKRVCKNNCRLFKRHQS